MCNLYSITTNQEAIRALFRVTNRYVGNLPPMPVFSTIGSGDLQRGPLVTHTSYIVPSAKARACAILAEFNKTQTELVGRAVILTDGKAGTVEEVWLDEIPRTANCRRRSRRQVAGLNNKIRRDVLTTPFPAG